MKKSNILIAVLAVLAAASVAKAEDFNVNFDGKLGPQSMHSIFAVGHNLVPASVLEQAEGIPQPTSAVPALRGGQSIDEATYKTLAAYYVAQPKIKAMLAGYYMGKGDSISAEKLADKSVRVLAAEGSVFVIANGRQERINDPALAAKVEDLAFPGGQQKFWPMVSTGLAAISTAANDAVWNAVGDAVSDASEAITHQYYTDGWGGGWANQDSLTTSPD